MKKNIAVILAGGSGSRFGLDIPKQFAKVAGKTLIEHTVDVFQSSPLIDEICIVIKTEWRERVEDLLIQSHYDKVKKVLNGGAERKDSSLVAIEAYHQAAKEVQINFFFHDAVRPFLNHGIIESCVDALEKYNAIDVAIPATDTIIEVKNSCIENIPKRADMMQGQTPQCFTYETISHAYTLAQKDSDFQPTDDCGVVKKYLPNEEIYVVHGSIDNIKITYEQDIFTADKIFQLKRQNLDQHYTNSYYEKHFNKKVLVVFGGSYGIGKDIAILAQKFGAKVYVFSRTLTGTNVSRVADIKKALQEVHQLAGKIDYVVNTASILLKEPLENTEYNSVIEIVNINYLGAVNVLKESIPYLEKTSGSLLNFTSSSYTRGRKNYALYSSTKAAIVNLTQAMGEELKSKKIRVNCMNPERTKTPMRTSNFGYEAEDTLLSSQEVAYASLNALLADFTAQIIDVKLQKKSQKDVT